MEVVVRLNNGFSRNNLSLAVQGGRGKGKLKQELLSLCYTIKMSDILKIK